MAMGTMNTTAMVANRRDSRQSEVKKSAVVVALLLLRQPALIRNILRQDIPDDVLVLLKISAGDTTVIQEVSTKHQVDSPVIVAAAKFYMQCILSHADGDVRRMLCLPANASNEVIREHKKWLLKWLHPDRNHDRWESTLFLKVNDAYKRLQTELPQKTLGDEVELLPAKIKRSSGNLHPPHQKPYQYVKLGVRGLFRRAAKPILLVIFIILLGIALLESNLFHLQIHESLISNFAF
jgi:hypothetical protein